MILGVQGWPLSTHTKGEPQALSCRALAERGPGDNAHVVLSDFMFSDGGYVYEEEKRGNDWKTVWVPAVPFELRTNSHGELEVNPEVGPVRVIVKSKPVDDERGLEALHDQETIQGVVINSIESLAGKERRLLEGSYPGLDLDSCWIVEHGRLPASTGKIAAMGAGGLVLLLAGGGWLLVGRRG